MEKEEKALEVRGGGVNTVKLQSPAGKIDLVISKQSSSNHITDKSFWYRVLSYKNNISVCGSITVSFRWYTSKPGSFRCNFTTKDSNVTIVTQFTDFRVSNYRIVKEPNNNDGTCYLDILISPNTQDRFIITSELYTNDYGKCYSGDVDANIPEGYSSFEYYMPNLLSLYNIHDANEAIENGVTYWMADDSINKPTIYGGVLEVKSIGTWHFQIFHCVTNEVWARTKENWSGYYWTAWKQLTNV